MIRFGVMALGLVIMAGPAQPQTTAEFCADLEARGNLGASTVQRCECNVSVAHEVLDDDIRAAMLESWNTGFEAAFNHDSLEPKSRVVRPFQTFLREVIERCL